MSIPRAFLTPLHQRSQLGKANLVVVLISVRQQSDVARALDRSRQLTLILSTGTSDTAWYDFASFSDVAFQGIQIFVIDLAYAFIDFNYRPEVAGAVIAGGGFLSSVQGATDYIDEAQAALINESFPTEAIDNINWYPALTPELSWTFPMKKM